MTYDPRQPGWANPSGEPARGGYEWSGFPPQGSDAYPPPGSTYQPPEGTYPGGYPPPPPPPGQAPYYGAYPGPMPVSTSGWAIASLILSIASWLAVPVVAAIAGVVCGHIALNEINQSEGRVQGRGMAIAGLILGYLNVAALCVGMVLFAVIFATLKPQ